MVSSVQHSKYRHSVTLASASGTERMQINVLQQLAAIL